MKLVTSAVAAVLFVVTGTLGHALPLTVASYDMPNGSGQASGGSFNYWDRSYSGSGATTTDGAPLTGGKGDLTDGVMTPLNWLDVENAAGTGPYVGWRSSLTPDPVVRFLFGGAQQVSSITIHMDDSNGLGGVKPPLSIDLSTDGVGFASFAVSDPASDSPFAVTLPFNATTNDLFVRFTHNDQWVFVDEVSFDGRPAAVPEPASLVLFGWGLIGLAAVRRRRQRAG